MARETWIKGDITSLPPDSNPRPKKRNFSSWSNRSNLKAIIIIIAILVMTIIIAVSYNLIVTYRQSVSSASRESIITTIPHTPSINFELSIFNAQIMIPFLSIIIFFIFYIYLYNSIKKKRETLISDIQGKVEEEISNINNELNSITSINYSQIPSLYKKFKELKSKYKKNESFDEIEQSEYERLEKIVSIGGTETSLPDLMDALRVKGILSLNDEEKKLIRFVYIHKNNTKKDIKELLEEEELMQEEIINTLELLFTYSELKLIRRYAQLKKLLYVDFDLLNNLSLTNLEKFEKDLYVKSGNLY